MFIIYNFIGSLSSGIYGFSMHENPQDFQSYWCYNNRCRQVPSPPGIKNRKEKKVTTRRINLMLAIALALLMDQQIEQGTPREGGPKRIDTLPAATSVCCTAAVRTRAPQKSADRAAVTDGTDAPSVQKTEPSGSTPDKPHASGIGIPAGRFSINRIRMVIYNSIPIARLIPFPASRQERPRRLVQ